MCRAYLIASVGALMVFGIAGGAEAARSITRIDADARHVPSGQIQPWTEIWGEGQVIYETGDTIVWVKLVIDGNAVTTNTNLQGSGSPRDWDGVWAPGSHQGGQHEIKARVYLQASGGGDHFVDSQQTQGDNCDS